LGHIGLGCQLADLLLGEASYLGDELDVVPFPQQGDGMAGPILYVMLSDRLLYDGFPL
jgi:hypothetical protein